MEPARMSDLTDAQRHALKWMHDRAGDGVFDRYGVLIAGGDRANFERSTLNRLRDAGLVEFYNPAGKGRGRCRLTTAGIDAAKDAARSRCWSGSRKRRN
jgi:hypothetical protein